MNRSILCDLPPFTTSLASRCERLLGGGVEALVPFGQVLVPAVTYRRTSVPEAKKEEQEQQVVLSRPSSSATTTVVVANGDPPLRKVTGPALRSKVVCHCCGADRFTTEAPLSDIAGLASILRISLHHTEKRYVYLQQ